jgi:hypothetical protein
VNAVIRLITRLLWAGARVVPGVLLVTLLAASPAQAQDLSGVWVMQGCWGSNCQNFTETYELASDGSFHAWGYRDAGTWSVSNGAFTLVIVTSDNTTYTGAVRDGVVSGTMRDGSGHLGAFSMQQAGGPLLEQARQLRDSWSGVAHWNTNDAAFVMVFNADGTFHVDNGHNGDWGNGNWQMSGSHITMRYTGSDNTVFSGALQGDVISGAITDSQGHSGTFSMDRRDAEG